MLMPFAKGDKLVILCTNKIPKKHRQRFERFSFQRPDAFQLRLKVCFNIAVAVYQVHQTQRYVLVDLKPDNILIQPNGLISIVDIDSMEVVENGKVLFPAPVTTPEYTPPEFYKGTQPGKTTIFEPWDLYSMAIIFYKLLFGIHPFASSAKPPYDKLNTLEEKIENGLFVHHPQKKHLLQVVPPPHRRFGSIPGHIQALFIKTFADGHATSALRPSSADWCTAITGRTFLATNRLLPSRVLTLGDIAYTRSVNLPVMKEQSLVPYKPPRPAPLPPAKFSNVSRGITIASIFGAIGLLALVKTPAVFLLPIFTIGILFNQNKSVSTKTRLKRSANNLWIAISRQRYKVKDIRERTYNYASNLQPDIQRLEANQQSLIRKEKQTIDELLRSYYDWVSEKDKLIAAMEVREAEEKKALEEKYPQFKNYEMQKSDNDFLSQQEQQEIKILKKELQDLDTLENSTYPDEIATKEYLRDVAYQLLQHNTDMEMVLKREEKQVDIKIAEAYKKLSHYVRTDRKIASLTIQRQIDRLRNDLNMKKTIIANEFKGRIQQTHEQKRNIIIQKREEINEQIQNTVASAKKQAMNYQNTDLTIFVAAQRMIKIKYDREYQLIMNDGKLKQQKFKQLIQEEQRHTKQKLQELLAKNPSSLETVKQYNHYNKELKKLQQLQNQLVYTRNELEAYSGINFWNYLEKVFGGGS